MVNPSCTYVCSLVEEAYLPHLVINLLKIIGVPCKYIKYCRFKCTNVKHKTNIIVNTRLTYFPGRYVTISLTLFHMPI
jgi:hypothetical protein